MMDKLICSDRILRHPQYHTWKKRDLAKAIEDAPTHRPRTCRWWVLLLGVRILRGSRFYRGGTFVQAGK